MLVDHPKKLSSDITKLDVRRDGHKTDRIEEHVAVDAEFVIDVYCYSQGRVCIGKEATCLHKQGVLCRFHACVRQFVGCCSDCQNHLVFTLIEANMSEVQPELAIAEGIQLQTKGSIELG